jgi:hypothetical protein
VSLLPQAATPTATAATAGTRRIILIIAAHDRGGGRRPGYRVVNRL